MLLSLPLPLEEGTQEKGRVVGTALEFGGGYIAIKSGGELDD